MKEISENVFKINADSNVYILPDKNMVIDTGCPANRKMLEIEIEKIIPAEKVKTVIFTHLHYDHTSNFDLFHNARFYASEEAIVDFKENPFGSVLNPDVAKNLSKIDLNPLDAIEGFEIIKTPGHTRGSFCLLYKEKKILFSGDTIFKKGIVGRTDLPTSVPDELEESLAKLKKVDYEILCPGHDY